MQSRAQYRKLPVGSRGLHAIWCALDRRRSREVEHATGPAVHVSDSAAAAHTRLAYEAVKERIASGAVMPGEWLREHTVATSLGLSRTPVREALRLLAAAGVVELVHNRGARVVDWTSEDIDEAYRLRALIEGYGAGMAARQAGPTCVPELRTLQDRYERALVEDGPATTPAQCNNDFHAAVLAASGSARLSALVAMVSSAPLVSRVLHGYSDDDRRRSVMAHRDVITAIDNGDEDLATSAISSLILAARFTALRSPH
jgi:DNA-binding GntR family transcriptional regulator